MLQEKGARVRSQRYSQFVPKRMYFLRNLETVVNAILFHISRVNLEEHGAKVNTVNLVWPDSTKSVYSTISSLLQSTVRIYLKLGGFPW